MRTETRSNHFDFENVAKRIKQAELKNKAQLHAKAARLNSRRFALRQRASAPPQQSVSSWSRLKTAVRDESKQLFAALLVLLGFATWLCSSAQALYAQRSEQVLAGNCQKNQLAHAGAGYCFDDRRIVHELNPDGSATKTGLDWRVNESAHRKAEAAAAHEARLAAESQ